jgi:hypothetical protein
MNALPDGVVDEREDAALEAEVREAAMASARKVVAYDDDPTGVQTVHDGAVLELDRGRACNRADGTFVVVFRSHEFAKPAGSARE